MKYNIKVACTRVISDIGKDRFFGFFNATINDVPVQCKLVIARGGPNGMTSRLYCSKDMRKHPDFKTIRKELVTVAEESLYNFSPVSTKGAVIYRPTGGPIHSK